MKLLSSAVVSLGLLAVVGCNTSPPGGSGSGVAKKATFDIHAPATSTALKQGDTKEVKLTISRGKDFHEDVDLAFSAPEGITVDPASQTVKASDDKEVTVKVTAAKDAAVSEHEVKVTGTPKTGNATSVTFKVKVEKSEAK
jgi:uncharacterized membrane protein